MGANTSRAAQKKGSLRNRPAKPLSPNAKADVASIDARRAARQLLNLEAVSLQVDWSSSDHISFQRDLTERYNAHPHHQALLLQLRLGMELKAKERPYTWVALSRLYNGSCSFIDFLNSDLAVIPGQVSSVAEITWHVAKAFANWLIVAFPNESSVPRKKYSGLRTVVQALQKKYASNVSVGQAFTWPNAPAHINTNNHEPYPDWLYQKIAVAAIRDVAKIMQTMKRYEAIIAETAPLDFIGAEVTLENVMATLRDEEANFDKDSSARLRNCSHKWAFTDTVRKRPYLTEFSKQSRMSVPQVMEIYWERGAELALEGQIIRKVKNNTTTKCLSGMDREQSSKGVIATLAHHFPNWPFGMEPAEAYETLKQGKGRSLLETRLTQGIGSVVFGATDSPIDLGQAGYFAYRMFTPATIFPLMLYVQLTTGWNMSVVASLTEDLKEHIGPCLEDSDAVMIYAMKFKNANSYSDPTIIPCKSDTKHPLSLYNVLRFVQKVTKQIQAIRREGSLSSLWKYITNRAVWIDNGSVIAEWSSNRSQNATRRQFYREHSIYWLKRHGIEIDAIESPRIRASWTAKRKEMGAFIEQISVEMGHANADTTDDHYDSSDASIHQKNKQLRTLMNHQVADLTNYGPRLAQDCALQELRKALPEIGDMSRKDKLALKQSMKATGLTEPEQIIHLLSPEGQTYIVSCVDSKSPTWPGARNFVPEGQDCRFFNKCGMCRNGVIFREALPYIARRILDLERLRDHELPITEWLKEYGDEHDAWSYAIDRWTNRKDVDQAWADARANKVLLPLTMRGA